jgi:hypothetical protein
VGLSEVRQWNDCTSFVENQFLLNPIIENETGNAVFNLAIMGEKVFTSRLGIIMGHENEARVGGGGIRQFYNIQIKI